MFKPRSRVQILVQQFTSLFGLPFEKICDYLDRSQMGSILKALRTSGRFKVIQPMLSSI